MVLPDVGDGTSSAPYEISNAGHLKAIADKVNEGDAHYAGAHYKLTEDIDLAPFRKGAGWTPIGDETNKFNGTFDGNGKTIFNLNISRTHDYAGLFGYVSSRAWIIDFDLLNCNVTGLNYVGGVAGRVEDSTLDGCRSWCRVSGNNYVGGIAGVVYPGSSITNSSARGRIEGNEEVGGIAGVALEGSISNSYATGNVTGSRDVGGVVGIVNDGEISNCYATGNVTGSMNNVGGVAGNATYASTINNCYARGNITGSNYVGGVVGSVSSAGSANYCAALNSSIVRTPGSSETDFGRVAGLSDGILYNNVANSAMTVLGVTTSSGAPNNPDGHGVDPGTGTGQFNNEDIYANAPLFWDFNSTPIWKWGGAANPYPILYWQ